ncbi:hypothetical protein AMECASPLE_006379 [Ameca splendens]|uniref:Uncharacterized protein n=1 Tax=Ameca splendens TaxID=208324 RepID=A0ABV0ZVB7_9TELE
MMKLVGKVAGRENNRKWQASRSSPNRSGFSPGPGKGGRDRIARLPACTSSYGGKLQVNPLLTHKWMFFLNAQDNFSSALFTLITSLFEVIALKAKFKKCMQDSLITSPVGIPLLSTSLGQTSGLKMRVEVDSKGCSPEPGLRDRGYSTITSRGMDHHQNPFQTLHPTVSPTPP